MKEEYAHQADKSCSSMIRTRRCASTRTSSASRRRPTFRSANTAGSVWSSPEDPNGTELVLEPDEHPGAKPFKAGLARDGIPFTSFAVDDVNREFDRLRALGVEFTQEPLDMGP